MENGKPAENNQRSDGWDGNLNVVLTKLAAKGGEYYYGSLRWFCLDLWQDKGESNFQLSTDN